MPKPGYTYVLAGKKRGTLYIGVTSALVGRVWKHIQGLVEGLGYGVYRLVYYEQYDDI